MTIEDAKHYASSTEYLSRLLGNALKELEESQNQLLQLAKIAEDLKAQVEELKPKEEE